MREVKGSALLEKRYDRCEIPYRKPESGVLPTRYLAPMNQPALEELASFFDEVIETNGTKDIPKFHRASRLARP
jgi:hypothetical protein